MWRLQSSVNYQVHYKVEEKFHIETWVTKEGKGILPLVKENTYLLLNRWDAT